MHLFLVDSFLAYVTLLAHTANRAARTIEPAGAQQAPAARLPRWRRASVPGPAVLPQLGPVG